MSEKQETRIELHGGDDQRIDAVDSDESSREYTKQDVINQSLVAFGQGTNFMRVSSRACREFVRLMDMVAEDQDLHEDWGEIAVQLLERIRSIGRVVHAWSVEEAETVIRAEHISPAFRKVGLTSKTESCGTTAAQGSGRGNQGSGETGGG